MDRKNCDEDMKEYAPRKKTYRDKKRKEGTKGTRSKSNDPSWYANNPQLLSDTASYPFGWPLGNMVDVYSHVRNNTMSTNISLNRWAMGYSALPGVLRMDWAPVIGYSEDANSPINLAARQIYTYVRHVNSGAKNYETPDLMIYILALDSVYSWWSALRRLYGVLMTYSNTNRYMPEAIVQAMGFNFKDCIQNMAQLRYHINSLAVALGKFAVPATMPYFARHMWLNEGYYMDAVNAKPQLYVFRQSKYYCFGYNTETKLGELTHVTADPNFTLADIIDFTNCLLDPITYDGDFGTMSGDILKAFGNDGILKTVAMPDDYYVLPTVDQEVLSLIQNATAYGTVLNGDITQVVDDLSTDSYLTSTPYVKLDLGDSALEYMTEEQKANLPIGRQNAIVTFYINSPTPADVVVATRFTNILGERAITKSGNNSELTRKLTTASSDVMEHFWVIKAQRDPNTGKVTFNEGFHLLSALPMSSTDTMSWLPEINQLAYLTKFDVHPSVTYYGSDSSVPDLNSIMFSVPIGDISNYTILHHDDLANMATMALQSMFAVPMMGVWNSRV